MNARKTFLLNLFLEDGLDANLLHQAAHLACLEGSLTQHMAVKETVKEEAEEEDLKEKDETVRKMDDQFKERFRMQRSTFEKLLQVVGRAIAGAEHYQPIGSVSLPEKLLYTLMLLGGGISFRDAGEIYSISKSSGHEIFKWVTSAFAALLPCYVKWPKYGAADEGSAAISELTGVLGVIDECRIPLKLPIRIDEDSPKQYPTLALQVVCDAQSRFLNVYIDVADEQQCILVASPLFEDLIDMETPLMAKHKHIVGDKTYPLLLNLMTPYVGEPTPCHAQYNLAIRQWIATGERAFATLIARFKRLESLDVSSLEVGTTVVSAACMLHNFILGSGGEDIEDDILAFDMLPENHQKIHSRQHGLLDTDNMVAVEEKRDRLIASFIKNI
ncbi:protein ALP1-like [Drosophila guanche]|uniref:Blast:Putative nuclease HARBI1 n=1 Tax=Drosophila guanche TaxID=7266 RepID=A0A3B0JVI1_DROGU|nr:protein ALP1-like [Drosophila guanche]SPP86105.1 blast:Putative nuclease HARBI1 [Drosophila guanche]